MVIMEGRYLRTGDKEYETLARFWTKIFALTFGIGVATGIVAALVADAGGVGEGLTDWLSTHLGRDRVTPYKFTRTSKAALGSAFLALIETGRFKYWTDDKDHVGGDGWWFWQQAAHCIS